MTYRAFVNEVIGFINIVIPAMFALVFLYFIWKMIDAWVLHAGDPNKVQEGKTFAVTAVFVLVVALSVWGIVSLLQDSFLGI